MVQIRSTFLFGRAAVALGLITEEQAAETAAMQEELEGEGITLKFGEILVEGKVLTGAQVEAILAARPETAPDPDDAFFGAIAVENGLLDPDALRECLDLQQDLASELEDPAEAPKVGELLLTQEAMEAPQVEAVLKVQQRLKVGAFSLTPSKLLLLRKKKKVRVRSPEEALFCKTAVRRHLLTPDQVAEILQIQMSDAGAGTAGEVAYELGYMDQVDVAAVLEAVSRKEGVQERRRRHMTTAGIRLMDEDAEFAAMAQKNGFVTESQVRNAQKAFKVFKYLDVHRSLGEILYDQRILTGEQIKAVLDILRLKGAVLPAYRLEEIELSDREDEVLAALVKEGDPVSQDQVTECTRIQKELRRLGVHRKLGEILLLKGYLKREDLKRKPVRRERRRRAAAAPRKEKKGLHPAVIAAAAAGAVGLLALLIAMAFSGKEPQRAPGPPPDAPETAADPEPAAVAPAADPGPKPGQDPVEQGYVKIRGQWVHKSRIREKERREFHEALRRAVAGR